HRDGNGVQGDDQQNHRRTARPTTIRSARGRGAGDRNVAKVVAHEAPSKRLHSFDGSQTGRFWKMRNCYEARRRANSVTASSCSPVSIDPGRNSRTRATAAVGVNPWATKYAARMVPVRPRPAVQWTATSIPCERARVSVETALS